MTKQKKRRKDLWSFFEIVERFFANISNNAWISILILVVLGSILSLYTFDRLLHQNGDNAVYLVLGKSLASGSGYHNIHSSAQTFHSKYPPVYPSFIALTEWLTSGTLITHKIVMVIIYLCTGASIYWAYRIKSNSFALALALLYTVNFWVNDYGHWLMSEIPCLLFIVLSIGFLYRSKLDSLKYIALAGLFAGLAILTRSFAIFLIVSGVVYLLIKNNWKGVFSFAGISLGSLFVWEIIKKVNDVKGSGYVQSILKVNPYRPELGSTSLVDLVSRVYENVIAYFGSVIPSMFLPSIFSDKAVYSMKFGDIHPGLTIVALAISLTLLMGLWKHVREGEWLNGLLLVTGFGILLLWPEVWTTQRFLIPVFPFIAIVGIKGLETLHKFNWGKSLQMLVFIIVLISSVVRMSPGRKNYPIHFLNYLSASKWLQQNSEKDDIIACRKGEFTYLFSGRRSVRYKYTFDDQELIEKLYDDNVKFVIVDQLGFSSTPRYLVPAIQKNQDRFEMVYVTRKPENWVLRFVD